MRRRLQLARELQARFATIVRSALVQVAVAMATLEKEQVVTEEGAEMTTPMSQTPTQ